MAFPDAVAAVTGARLRGEIVREDGRGRILRMSSDLARLYGYNPTLVVCDEVAQWVTPTLANCVVRESSSGTVITKPDPSRKIDAAVAARGL